MRLLEILGAFSFVILSVNAQGTTRNCLAQFRRFNEQPCLDDIVRLANSVTAYWFGRNLESRCDTAAQADINNLNCYLGNLGPRKYSIIQRLFSVDPNINRLEQYLTVTYASPEGNYTACGGNFVMPRRGVDANPDMDLTSSWFLRSSPMFSLRVEAGAFYTILILDGSSGDVFGAVINYPLPEVAVRYRPPLTLRNTTTPVVFLAYKQNGGNMQLSQKWLGIMSASDSGKNFDLSSFILDQQLGRLVAMNIMPVGKDPWAADQLQKNGGPNFCAQYIGEVLQNVNEIFIKNLTTSTMNSFLEVGFTSPASSFSVCCTNFSQPDQTVLANPLSDQTIAPILVRNQPTVRVNAANSGASVGGRLYTVLAVDPTIPKNALATPERPYVQWLVMNADFGGANNPISGDTEVMKYAPTIPAPQSPPHTIFFFLFEQPDRINTKDIAAKYSDPSCVDFLYGRCLFQIINFVQNFGLTLRAASWITVVNDAYARYWMIKSGQIEWDICAGQPFYQVPCPRPGEIQLARVTEVKSSGFTSVAGSALLIVSFLFIVPVMCNV